ncbi:MAG: hypothetical protein WC758_06420 [Candidatus Woesearchaeota archaeon]|jgi:hypothetical protein
MTQQTQKTSSAATTKNKQKSPLSSIILPITTFLARFTKKEQIAYGLIILGIIFLILGLILW